MIGDLIVIAAVSFSPLMGALVPYGLVLAWRAVRRKEVSR